MTDRPEPRTRKPRLARAAIKDMAYVEERVGVIRDRLPEALRNLAREGPGYPTGGVEPVAGGGPSDRTGDLAAGAVAGDLRDPAFRGRRRVDELIDTLVAAADDLVSELHTWNPSAAWVNHQVAQRELKDSEMWCVSCGRLDVFSPTRALGAKLCDFCYRWSTELGLELPPTEFVEQHYVKHVKRLPQALIDRYRDRTPTPAGAEVGS